jgi:Protein of unknown function (DUF2800)
MVAPTGHSLFGMSVMERRIACPGSALAEKGLPDRSTSASDRGTYLHELAARALLGDVQAAYEPEDAEDSKVVLDYVDAVQSELMRYERMHLVGECATPVLFVEQRFHLDHIDDELWGTADALILAPPYVHVFDLKTGYVAVELVVTKGEHEVINPQLGGYMLGGIRAAQKISSGVFSKFRMSVIQPARGGTKTIPVERKQLAQLAASIVDTLEAARKPDAPRVPGDHCGFCKARGVCPALRESALGEARAFFQDEALEVPAQEVVEIESEDLAKLIALGERVDAWLKAVRAEAWHRLNEGTPVPGLKLIAKRATRKWRDEAAALQRLKGEGLEDADLYSRKFKSPAQIEKIGKELKPLVGELTEKISTGAKLVPEDHPDPAVAVGAAGVFTDVTDEKG